MIFLCLVRSLLVGLLFIITTLFLAIVIIFLTYFKNTRDWIDKLIVFWGRSTLFYFNVEVSEVGRDHIPKGPCIYLFNHTSFFDVFVMVATLKGMRFGSKIELFSIPFFGQAIRKVGVLPIARHNREEVFKVYEKAIEYALRHGQQYSLAPEGTRQSEEKLGPFKAGPFIFAINAKIPLVPVVLCGASRVMSKNSFLPNWRHWKNKINIEYLAPISTQGESLETRQSLQKKVFELMNQKLHENQSRLNPG
jgi:1-acyl-sn-glycerol-3-phosphate acyltransferase